MFFIHSKQSLLKSSTIKLFLTGMIFSYVILLCSCMESSQEQDLEVMVIRHMSPSKIYGGSQLSIQGIGFGIQGQQDQVYLSGTPLIIKSWYARKIEVLIPQDIKTGHKALVIYADGYYSQAKSIEVLVPK